ncbi:protein MENT-like [Microtus oregoni]|uniref:protein MENT-like n=1 Tax=Microtus oregoni TaxID=111838 RepID=UPI001BB12843|nr:protein MENT-like [Microtus oregoni]
MVPAACMLLWALLLSLGLRAAGAQDQTSNPTSMPRISVRFGPARSRRSTSVTIRNSVHRKVKVTLEDDNDALATADRLAAPAAAELLSTVSGISRSSASNFNEYDGSLEEGAVIDAKKTTYPATLTSTSSTMSVSTAPGRFVANSQEREIRMTTTDLPPLSSKPVDLTSETLESTLHQWSTPGSTPTPWRKASPTAMPSPEDLRVMLMPWGPWHCHCKSGTMSRSRAGKLHGISGRLRIGALNELRTEHRPCTYQQCPCNKLLEECPLDSSLCPDSGCSSPTTGMSTTSPQAPVHLRRRPILPPTSPSPSPALAFWKRVRINLEDIWNSLSSVFTEMQPVSCFAEEQGVP